MPGAPDPITDPDRFLSESPPDQRVDRAAFELPLVLPPVLVVDEKADSDVGFFQKTDVTIPSTSKMSTSRS